jgi:Guanine nucleotide exchange factor synembryn
LVVVDVGPHRLVEYIPLDATHTMTASFPSLILKPNRRPGREILMSEWNDLLDEAFKNPTDFFDYSFLDNETFPTNCLTAFEALKRSMVLSLFDHDDSPTFVAALFETKHTEESLFIPEASSIEAVVRRRTERTNQITRFDLELVRCAQNLLRWYIQVCLRRDSRKTTADPLKAWKDLKSLELFLDLMEVRELGRYASQLFFFATFPALPHDQDLIDAINELVTQHNFAVRLLILLARANLSDERLLLSLVRNVHNAVSGFPEQCLRPFEQASATMDSDWGGQGGSLSFASILREVGIATLQSCDDSLSDLSVELVVELLRCSFAMRLGSKALDDRWRLFIDLCLHSDSKLCQNSAVSILADAPIQYDLDSSLMLGIISRLLDDTNSGLIDDSEAAAIIPILAVLHKFCVANPEFRMSMRKGIFVDEPGYQAALKLEIEKTGSNRPRNAKPLGTPKGSLRFNLVRLMTCPHGIVKRLAGELFWSILDGHKDEFVRRVGLGNALPFLSAKGLAKLPV